MNEKEQQKVLVKIETSHLKFKKPHTFRLKWKISYAKEQYQYQSTNYKIKLKFVNFIGSLQYGRPYNIYLL